MPSDAGDMWHALAALRQTHSEPFGRLVPFERVDALLSLTRPGDIAFTARVELSGGETMGHVHDLITTVTRGITYELGAAAPGTALEILLGKHHQLALHTDHVDALTHLLRDAVTTIDAHSTTGGGLCSHCHGTGGAHPLWAPAAGQA
ncbi:hypothetical protein [Streptomyces sp. 2132.2]|uniref:hypothetical protein n=1 Tax=Streptomyces sp. 2132.2 TaxID=2485161 RepID=UPI0021A7DDFE|nr:hypothetical protein [Streptomyces sp. 2132.2]